MLASAHMLGLIIWQMATIHRANKYLYQKCRTHNQVRHLFYSLIRFGYFAYSVARLSRITLTLIWPG